MITLVRVDDRLIHGQVATTWIRAAGGDFVLLVDQKTAQDDFLKNLQKISCPKDVQLKIRSAEKAIPLINEKYKDVKFFLLVGNISDLYTLCMNCPEIKEVDLGNLGYRNGKENLINRLFVTTEERDLLNKISAKGVRLYAQMLPQDNQDPVNEIL